MPDKVHNKLRLLRKIHDLTQEQLGEVLGVTRHTILAIENGKYEPSIALALKIASYFVLPLEEIFWLETGAAGSVVSPQTNGAPAAKEDGKHV